MSDSTLITNGFTTVETKLDKNGILDIIVYRDGKQIQHRRLGPDVNYDD